MFAANVSAISAAASTPEKNANRPRPTNSANKAPLSSNRIANTA